MKPKQPPETLSVVIPTLNERDNIRRLCGELLQQTDVDLKIIFVDGGSRDGSQDLLESLSNEYESLEWLESAPGRALQMNLGASEVQSGYLLFLHADSYLQDNALLQEGLAELELQNEPQSLVAGHFGLRFLTSVNRPRKGYFFYEAKSHLNRAECVNGDQGMLMSINCFRELGGFDTSLTFLEDLRLSRQVELKGRWINLPGVLHTSARRFEVEGLASRQALNSFIKCFDSTGFQKFYLKASDAYRVQSDSERLLMKPFARLALTLSAEDGLTAFLRQWYLIGEYVAQNAWQLAFLMDCRRSDNPAEIEPRWLNLYESRLKWLIESPPASALTGVLTLTWVTYMALFSG